MSEELNTDNRLADPDDLYQRLIELHRDLNDEQSHALNARLILLLANHIGDADVLGQALDAAAAGQSDPGRVDDQDGESQEAIEPTR